MLLRERRASPRSLRTPYTRCSSGSSRRALSTSRNVRPRRGLHAKCTRSTLREKSTWRNSGPHGALCPSGSNSSAIERNEQCLSPKCLVGSLDGKRRYRQYKARTAQLPADYRAALEALEALERYLMCLGPGTGARLAEAIEKGRVRRRKHPECVRSARTDSAEEEHRSCLRAVFTDCDFNMMKLELCRLDEHHLWFSDWEEALERLKQFVPDTPTLAALIEVWRSQVEWHPTQLLDLRDSHLQSPEVQKSLHFAHEAQE